MFTGKEGKAIKLAEAKTLISGYRKSKSFSANKNIKGGFYGKDILKRILAQKNCVGIRYYYASYRGKPTLVLVGVDKEGDDLTKGVIAEFGPWCPPWCGNTAVL